MLPEALQSLNNSAVRLGAVLIFRRPFAIFKTTQLRTKRKIKNDNRSITLVIGFDFFEADYRND